MEKLCTCPLCGRVGPRDIFTAEDHASGQHFGLVGCTGCGLVWTNPRPAPDEMAGYYPPAYYGPQGRRFRFGLERIVHFLRGRLARRLSRRFPDGGRILEIGSGRGTLLAEMALRGWQAFGTEYSPALAQATEKLADITVFATPDLRTCAFPTAHFDVVVLYHVLEHLPAPVDTLSEVRRVLRPGGLLVVAVPNFGGWISRLCGSEWFALDVPRHLFHFTSKTLSRAIEQTGFAGEWRSTLSLEQDVFGLAQSVLNLAGAPFNLFYDMIRSQQARLRSGGYGAGRVSTAVVFAAGLALSLIGAPLVLLAGACGQGGTVEYWARPR